MDSMLGGVLGLGWLPALLAVVLIAAGLMLLMRRFAPDGRAAGGVAGLILTALAVAGGVVLVAALAAGTLRF
jgi:hypothetical protein